MQYISADLSFRKLNSTRTPASHFFSVKCLHGQTRATHPLGGGGRNQRENSNPGERNEGEKNIIKMMMWSRTENIRKENEEVYEKVKLKYEQR